MLFTEELLCKVLYFGTVKFLFTKAMFVACNKVSLYTLLFCSGRFVGFFPVVIIFPMLFAENKKKRKS